MRKPSTIGLGLLFLLFAAGCDTTGGSQRPDDRVTIPVLQGPRDRQAAELKTITIPTFRNQTYEYGIEDYLTNAVIKEFITDARLEVRPAEAADLVLRGKIYRYIKEPVVYSDQDEVLKYSVGIWVELALYETGNDTALWRDADIYAKSTYSEVMAPIETEREVQRRLIDELAVDVVDRLFEGWSRIER